MNTREEQIEQLKAMAQWLIDEAESIVGDGEQIKDITVVANAPTCGKAKINVHKGLKFDNVFDEWADIDGWDDYKYGIG